MIRTDMFFEPRQMNWPRRGQPRQAHRVNPGLSFAWFEGSTTGSGVAELLTSKIEIDSDEIGRFIDMALVDGRSMDVERPEEIGMAFWTPAGPQYLNRPLVDYVLDQPIVIERSPPVHEVLRHLGRNAAVAVGLYMGAGAVVDHHPLLFLTIPSGIIVAGASIGVAKAFEKGIPKVIEKRIGGRRGK